MRKILIVTAIALAAGASLSTPAAAHPHVKKDRDVRPDIAVAEFVGGSGVYLTTDGTDGPTAQPTGWVTFRQKATGKRITASGRVFGLEPNKSYVVVPYKDANCLPAVGVTAFPSVAIQADRKGRIKFNNRLVNPAGINPAGSFNVAETRSVSVREVVVSIPGVITIPNGAEVKACDESPMVRT